MRSPLVWQGPSPSAGRVLIEAEPLELMDRHWQDSVGKPESGGILLGYRRGDHLQVTIASAPQKADRGWRYQFVRSARHHQEIALRHWHASDQKIDYLGEWHTHPECQPNPSATDLSEWRKICRQREARMVFLIMGWGGELWMGVSKGVIVERCTAISF